MCEREEKTEMANMANVLGLIFANISSNIPNTEAVPKSLQMILIFPYTAGFSFVHNILNSNIMHHF